MILPYNGNMGGPANFQIIQEKLSNLYPLLRAKYQVASLGIFGSYARQEQRPNSDLDLLITFSSPVSLLRFIEIENFISDSLGIKVDLVVQDALKPVIRERILDEVIPL